MASDESTTVRLFEFRGVIVVSGLEGDDAIYAAGVGFDAGMQEIKNTLTKGGISGEVSALMVANVTTETAQALLDLETGDIPVAHTPLTLVPELEDDEQMYEVVLTASGHKTEDGEDA